MPLETPAEYSYIIKDLLNHPDHNPPKHGDGRVAYDLARGQIYALLAVASAIERSSGNGPHLHPDVDVPEWQLGDP